MTWPYSIIVPWFSRKEWMDVFKATFSNDIHQWKEARDTMLVWHARVRKLPIGVDLTLPLLQAKIVGADPLLDNDLKSIMQATSLQRFVSNVVKLPQTKYYSHQTMHKLASNVGLPGHLVDLRNEIIHGENGWTGGCTVTEALETAFVWIKDYYWNAEFEKMEKKMWKVNGKSKKKKAVVKLVPTLLWKKFTSTLNKFMSLLLNSLDLNILENETVLKLAERTNKLFKASFAARPDRSIEAVVSRLLSPSNGRDKLCNDGNRLDCGCYFKEQYTTAVSLILKPLLALEGINNLLLDALLNKVQECQMSLEWLQLIIRSMIKSSLSEEDTKDCKVHLLSLDKTHKDSLNWKKLVLSLLELEEEWALNLCLRMLASNETSLTEIQVKQLKHLLNVMKYGENGDVLESSLITEEEINKQETTEIADVFSKNGDKEVTEMVGESSEKENTATEKVDESSEKEDKEDTEMLDEFSENRGNETTHDKQETTEISNVSSEKEDKESSKVATEGNEQEETIGVSNVSMGKLNASDISDVFYDVHTGETTDDEADKEEKQQENTVSDLSDEEHQQENEVSDSSDEEEYQREDTLSELSDEEEENLGNTKISALSSELDDNDASTEPDIFCVETVIEQVKQMSNGKNTDSLLPSVTYCRTPLGILPHQMSNKDFYKELLLDFPEEGAIQPSFKRMKL